MHKIIILCFLVLGLGVWCHLTPDAGIASPNSDSHVTVTARISPSNITVGDHMLLVFTVTHPEGVSLELPNVTQDISPFEIVEVGQVQSSKRDNMVVVEAEYKVTGFMVGELSLPSIKIRYTEPAGATGEVASPSLPVTISSVLNPNGEEGINDLKPPISIARDPIPYRQLATNSAGILALVFLMVLIVKRLTRARKAPVIDVQEESPEERARRELGRIEALYLNNGTVSYADYYSSIAGCVRSYLAQKYGPWTLGCTTKELREKMEHNGVERWQARVVYGLLDECDSVRWSRYSPATARAERAIALAYEIVGSE